MELALLALRVVIGLTFAAHGAQKVFGLFDGGGIGGVGAVQIGRLVAARAAGHTRPESTRAA